MSNRWTWTKTESGTRIMRRNGAKRTTSAVRAEAFKSFGMGEPWRWNAFEVGDDAAFESGTAWSLEDAKRAAIAAVEAHDAADEAIPYEPSDAAKEAEMLRVRLNRAAEVMREAHEHIREGRSIDAATTLAIGWQEAER